MTAAAAAKAAKEDADLAKAAAIAAEAAATLAVMVLVDNGVKRPVLIRAAGAGVWGNDLKVTVTQTKADVLVATAVTEANKKLPSNTQVPVPTIHFDVAVSLHGQPVEGWTFLDGREDGDKFYASLINRFSSYLKIEPDADGEFVQGERSYLATTTTSSPASANGAPPALAAAPGAPLAPAPGAPCGQRSVLGFNLNKLMNGLAARRRVVLVG